jgi:maltose alpha-D-glucosyltransferase/alpha-amylase
MLEVRTAHKAFGFGAFTELGSSNPSMLSYLRRWNDDVLLCVNNLSRFPQPVELDLRRFVGVTPVECMGGVVFPRIGELTYLLTLPGHGFYWFQLPAARDENGVVTSAGGGGTAAEEAHTPTMGDHLPGPPDSHQQ